MANKRGLLSRIFPVLFLIFLIHAADVQAQPAGFVLIAHGTFTMGSDMDNILPDEQPLHSVTISKDFYMSPTEVTREEWSNVMGTKPWMQADGVTPKAGVFVPPGSPVGDQYPVTYVSWYDAIAYVIAKNGGSETGHYRLPTEAEWEYAARGAGGATDEPFSPGITALNIGDYAWFRENTILAAPSEPYPHTCGVKEPNIWGVYDMNGNAAEWCTDWYGAYSTSAQTDPAGPSSGNAKVLRGGAYYRPASNPPNEDCRSSNREAPDPDTVSDDIGFRVVWMVNAGTIYPATATSSSGSGGSGSFRSSSSSSGGGGGGCFIRSLFP